MTYREKIIQSIEAEYDGIATTVEIKKIYANLGGKAARPSFSFLVKEDCKVRKLGRCSYTVVGSQAANRKAWNRSAGLA